MTANRLKLYQLFPYGAPELNEVYNRYLTWALGVAILFNVVAIALWIGGREWSKEPEVRLVRMRVIKDIAELGPPPSIAASSMPAIAVSTPVARPSVGIPVPVPDAQITPEATIATQQELSQFQAPITGGEGGGAGDSLVIGSEELLFGEEEPGMDEFIPFQTPPAIIKRVQPVYPELARKAGVQGKVFVKALIDKKGQVKKVVPLQGPEIFYEAAIAAVQQWVFKPAISQDQPVAVWMAIPINFVLQETQAARPN